MADAVEILIKARNDAKTQIDEAIRQVIALQGTAAKTGPIVRAQFGDVARAISAISPQAAAATSQIQQIAAAGAGLGVVGTALLGVAAGLGAVVTAGVAAARALGDQIEQLDNLHAATGVEIQDLQVAEEFLNRKGVAAGSLTTAMQHLLREIEQGNPLLKQLGINTRDPLQAIIQLGAAFSSSTDAARKAEIQQQLLGRGGRELQGVIEGLAREFPALRAEMLATSQILSKDMIDAGRKFDAEWEKFAGRFAGFMNQIKGAAASAANATIDAFTPASEGAAGAVEKQAAGVELLRRQLEDMTQQFGEADPAVQGFAAHIATLERQAKSAAGALREFGEDDLPLVGPPGRAPEIAELPDPTPGKEDARAKARAERLQEIQRLLGLTRSEAEKTLAVLERVEGAGKAASIRNTLDKAREGALEVADALRSIPAGLPPLAFAENLAKKQIEETAAAATKFRAQIDSIAEATGLSRDFVEQQVRAREEAEKVARAYEAIGQAIPKNIRDILKPPSAPRSRDEIRQERAGERDRQFNEDLERITDPGRMDEVRKQWIVAFEDIASSASLMDGTIRATFDGTVELFNAVTNAIVNGSNVMKIRVGDIFKSMISQVLAELNRLAVARIFKLFLQLTGIGSPASAVIDSPIGEAGGAALASARPSQTPSFSASPTAPATTATSTSPQPGAERRSMTTGQNETAATARGEPTSPREPNAERAVAPPRIEPAPARAGLVGPIADGLNALRRQLAEILIVNRAALGLVRAGIDVDVEELPEVEARPMPEPARPSARPRATSWHGEPVPDRAAAATMKSVQEQLTRFVSLVSRNATGPAAQVLTSRVVVQQQQATRSDALLDKLARAIEQLVQPEKPAAAAAGTVNVNINANDAKSFKDFMTSPLGAGRLAELRASAGQGI